MRNVLKNVEAFYKQRLGPSKVSWADPEDLSLMGQIVIGSDCVLYDMKVGSYQHFKRLLV